MDSYIILPFNHSGQSCSFSFHKQRDRCCLLALTGAMTHFCPAESSMKCPKYHSNGPLLSPACDQPLISFLIKKARERFLFPVCVTSLRLWGWDTTQSWFTASCHQHFQPSHMSKESRVALCTYSRLDLLFALHLTNFAFRSCLTSWYFSQYPLVQSWVEPSPHWNVHLKPFVYAPLCGDSILRGVESVFTLKWQLPA